MQILIKTSYAIAARRFKSSTLISDPRSQLPSGPLSAPLCSSHSLAVQMSSGCNFLLMFCLNQAMQLQAAKPRCFLLPLPSAAIWHCVCHVVGRQRDGETGQGLPRVVALLLLSAHSALAWRRNVAGAKWVEKVIYKSGEAAKENSKRKHETHCAQWCQVQ